MVDGRLSKISEDLVGVRPLRLVCAVARPHARLRAGGPRSSPRRSTSAAASRPGWPASRTDQCFGTWSGRIVPDEGEAIAVNGLQGWAEECTWRW